MERLVSAIVPETVPYPTLVSWGGVGGGRRGVERIVIAIVPEMVPYPALVIWGGAGGGRRGGETMGPVQAGRRVKERGIRGLRVNWGS